MSVNAARTRQPTDVERALQAIEDAQHSLSEAANAVDELTDASDMVARIRTWLARELIKMPPPTYDARALIEKLINDLEAS